MMVSVLTAEPAEEWLEVFVRNLSDGDLLVACVLEGGGDGVRIVARDVAKAKEAAILQMIFDAEAAEIRRLAKVEWTRRFPWTPEHYRAWLERTTTSRGRSPCAKSP